MVPTGTPSASAMASSGSCSSCARTKTRRWGSGRRSMAENRALVAREAATQRSGEGERDAAQALRRRAPGRELATGADGFADGAGVGRGLSGDPSAGVRPREGAAKALHRCRVRG